jgi:hypothetical protein
MQLGVPTPLLSLHNGRGASVPSHALRHAVNIAGSATPFSWKAKPQPMNHSDPRHIKTAG